MNIIKTIKAKKLAEGRTNRNIRGIVLHDTAGSGGHGDTLYLANDPEKRGVSVDFTVERDGKIYQLNPDLRKCWTYHAGRSTRFKGLRNGEVNRGTIGIEITQKANLSLIPMWPEEQVKAVAELCAYLCNEFGLLKEDITTHQLIITDGSRTDPRKWPFTKFWEYFNNYAIGIGNTHLSGKILHEVKVGDTLYSLAKKYGTTVEKIKDLNSMFTASNAIRVGQYLLIKE